MRRTDFRHKAVSALLALMIYSLVFPYYIFALPQGAQVVHGQADIAQSAGRMQIQQATGKAIINWQQFNIARPEVVQFIQPGTSAVALNRVIGQDPSAIYGLLSANGRLFLINPNGILIGPSGRIQANSFLASTLNMSNEDFLSGNYKLVKMPKTSLASILNQGTITAAEGGSVGLFAPGVENQGTIRANLGKVAIGAGEEITVAFEGNELIRFAIDREVRDMILKADGTAADSLVNNTGTIGADGGGVEISARAAYTAIKSVVNNQGIIEAKAVGSRSGTIRLDGGNRGEVVNAGTLNASGTGRGQSGGEVQVTGEKVKLVHYSKVLASGFKGGGKVRIGGGYQGKNPSIRNAKETTVGENAVIEADAIEDGDGGNVVVWSDDTTRFSGTISARGGEKGGDGGFVEVSGKKNLDFDGYVDLRAPKGEPGTLLLDPENLTVDGEEPVEGTETAAEDGSTESSGGDTTETTPASSEAESDGSSTTESTTGDTTGTDSDGSGETTTEETTTVAETDSQTESDGTSSTDGETTTAQQDSTSDGTASEGDTSTSGDTGTAVADSSEQTTETTSTTEESTSVDAEALEQIYADGSNVVFQASDSVTISESVNLSGGGSLSISAGGDVNVNASVSLSGGSMSSRGVDFTNRAPISTGGGSVSLNHSGNVTIGASINTGGGSFSSRGARFDGTGGSISAGSASLSHSAAVALGSMNIGGNLSVSAGGDITQSAALSIAGEANFSTSGANLTDFAVTDNPNVTSSSTSESSGTGETESTTSSTDSATDLASTSLESESIDATADSDGRENLIAEASSDITDPTADLDTVVGGRILLDFDDNVFSDTVRLETDPDGRIVLRSGSSPLKLGASKTGGSLDVASADTLTVTESVEGGSVALTAGTDITVDADVSAVAEGGDVGLTAADAVTITGAATISASDTVTVEGGTVESAGTIRSTASEGGTVAISSGAEITLTDTSIIQAQAGSVTIKGGETGIVAVRGTVDVSGVRSGQIGGTVHVLGEKVGLLDNAFIDASGDFGGGSVLVGGDFQGSTFEIRNAARSYVGPDAVIAADALTEGDGGKVIVWADDATWFHGSASVRGGLQNGDGGLIETSGKRTLFVGSEARIDLSAPNGISGEWLLDPTNVTLSDSLTSGMSGDPNWADDGTNPGTGNIQISAIESVLNQNNGGTVTVTTVSGDGVPTGWIRIDDPIDVDLTAGFGADTSTLTLTAEDYIQIDATITLTDADSLANNDIFNLNLYATNGIDINAAISSTDSQGRINLTTQGTDFDNTGGAITTLNGNVDIQNTGAVTIGGSIDAGIGNIDIGTTGGGASSIVDGGGTITSSGTISLEATGNIGQSGSEITIAGTGTIAASTTTSGDIYVNNTGDVILGTVSATGSDVIISNAGTLNITGATSAGTDGNVEITVTGDTNTLTVGNTITAGTNSGSIVLIAPDGININDDVSTSDGSITINADSDSDGTAGTFTLADTKSVSVGGTNNMTITAVDVALNTATSGGLSAGAGNTLFMYPGAATQDLYVGTASVGSDWSLTTAEINDVSAGTLVIGQTGIQSGDVFIDNLTTSSTANLEFYSDAVGGLVSFQNNRPCVVAVSCVDRSTCVDDNISVASDIDVAAGFVRCRH